MAKVTVTTTITSYYEVPDGVSLERIRELALSEILEDESAANEVIYLHDQGLSSVFFGDHFLERQSVEHSVD